MEVSSVVVIFSSTLLLAILTLGWRILNWVWLRPKYLERRLREQGFSGNSYRLFFGDMKDGSIMSKQAKSKPINFSDDISPRVVPIVHHTLKNYGKNFFIWIGPKPRVYIMDPEQIKDVFTNIGEFQKPRINPLSKLLLSGVVSYEGEKWVKHRKIINPAFRIEKLKGMTNAFYQSCNDMISQWERLIGEEGSCEFLPTKMNKRMKEIDREVRTLLTEIINNRERERKAGNAANDDLLGILLESNSRELRESGNETNAAMSLTDVIEECKLFYFAGQETTSVLLVWTMVLLSKYPNWQVRAREEVLQVFGKNKPDFDGLHHLKVVTMILHEVLRFYPPVTLLNRAVDKDTKLGNLIIPAGAMIGLPIILIQRDCELWGDNANEFDPERFSEGVSKATKGQLSFFPFGGGPRLCIGQNFAMMEAKMALSLILQHFSFEISSSYTHAPFTIITLQPQFGAHIVLHKL
ncbi:hypothetical protein FH972_019480 [Carpinus fangiana]|uniref:Cytochrome P450 n=1 Tax=Carpinus fangiana TaxID=176857 RepID=A0A5N6RTT5_9ROSI|nr:hypothetical protein FH972_019480 [Carpinus fangiana]